jgi:uncharacterized protein (DUF433 family)
MTGDELLIGFERITSNPNKCGGLPCVRGMRIRVIDVLELLAAKVPIEQILREQPDLEEEDIIECRRYANDLVERPD